MMVDKVRRSRRKTGGLSSSVLAVAVAVFSHHADAELVNNLTIGNPVALALGNAVTADPPGVDSIHFNPAGLARIHGREGLLKLTAASFNFRIEFGEFSDAAQQQLDAWGKQDPVENSVSETDTAMLRVPFREALVEWPLPFLLVPTGGAAFRPEGARYTFGTAAYSPMAAGYKRDSDDPGRFMGEELSLVRITYFAPTVGLQLNDEWSVGMGFTFSWQGAVARTQLRVPHLAVAVIGTAIQQIDDQTGCSNATEVCRGVLEPFQRVADLEFNADTMLSTGINFGLMWHPVPWFTWGAVYQSESKSNMTGFYKFTYGDEWVNLFSGIYEELGSAVTFLGLPTGRALEEGDAKLEFITPQHFATGISVQITPRWKFNMDAKWTDWAVWEGLTIEFDQPMDFLRVARLLAPEYATLTTLTIPRHYESVWNFAFGVEHQYSDTLVLRAGWEPRKTSIPDDKQDVLLPLGDGDLYAVGAGYQWNKDSRIDFALAYFKTSANVPAGTSTNANSENQLNNFLYNPYSGLDFKSEVEAYIFELSYTTQF